MRMVLVVILVAGCGSGMCVEDEPARAFCIEDEGSGFRASLLQEAIGVWQGYGVTASLDPGCVGDTVVVRIEPSVDRWTDEADYIAMGTSDGDPMVLLDDEAPDDPIAERRWYAHAWGHIVLQTDQHGGDLMQSPPADGLTGTDEAFACDVAGLCRCD